MLVVLDARARMRELVFEWLVVWVWNKTLPQPPPAYIITKSLFTTSNHGEVGIDLDRAACVAGLNDQKAVHSYASDPEVVRYMDWGPNTEQETVNFIQRSIAARKSNPA